MQEVGEVYQRLLEGRIQTERITVPFFSSVAGKAIIDSSDLGPAYWRRNLELPVLFYSATRAMLEGLHQENIFLEIGPHSALAGPLRQISGAIEAATPLVYVPTIVRDKCCTESLLSTAGELHVRGIPIDVEAVVPGSVVLTDLPAYPWRHETKYWNESRITHEWRMRRFPRHELLGSRILEGNELEPTWRNVLRLKDVPWIQDHKVIDDIVFPAAGYMSMAGEAIRQLTVTEDFTLRHVVIQTALVLHDSKTTEMMTTLRPMRLTETLDSSWYEFSISSYNETLWTKHCFGQVKAGPAELAQPKAIDHLVRHVSADDWYLGMKRIGLNYGPAFQGLTGISASPKSGTAVASLCDRHRSSGTWYQLHPTTIDLCLQLFTVGMAQGTTRRLRKLCVPTSIEELYMRRGNSDLRVEVIASSSPNGTITGDAIVMAEGEVVLYLKQGKFSPLESQDPTKASDTTAAAQLDWKPDIDFVPASKLMRPSRSLRNEVISLEKLTLLCILETRNQISLNETKVAYLQKFQAWLDLQHSRAKSGIYGLVEDAQRIASLNHDELLELTEATSLEVENNAGAGIGKVLRRILEQCQYIFEGKADSLDILLQEDGLNSIYGFMSDMWDCHNFFGLLGHAKPTLKVLEIGAGTGGTTAGVLRDLKLKTGERMYSQYSYTDISAGFFIAAKDRFKDYENIHYAVLDISRDPLEQGFEAESYDLILASNVGSWQSALKLVADLVC